MNMTHRELAHVLIGLRLLTDNLDALEDHDCLDGAEPMDAGEIDDLCEKLNFSDEESDPPLGYKILADGVFDPYYAIKDDDFGTIVTGAFTTRTQAVAAAWKHYRGE